MTFNSSIILSDFGFKIHSNKNTGILFLFFLLVGISSCKKDSYVDSEAENIQPTYISGGKISKEDAMKYYSNFTKRNNSGSFNNTPKIINLRNIELFWDASQTTLYKSQLDLLLVPVRLSSGLSMQMGREILFVFYADSNNIVRHRIFIISATDAYLDSEPLNFGQTFTGVVIQLDSLGAVLPSYFIRDGILESNIRPKTELTSRNYWDCVVVGEGLEAVPATWDALNGNGCDVSCQEWLEYLHCVGMGNSNGGGPVWDPFGTGNNDPFDFGTPGSTSTGGGSGTGENPGSISNYFNINDFEGDERRVASLINEFKKHFGLTQSSLDILNSLLNECGYFPDFKKISAKLKDPCSLDECAKTLILRNHRTSNSAVGQRIQELAAQEVYDACNGIPINVDLEAMEKELSSGCSFKGYTVEALEELYQKALDGFERIITLGQLQTLCPKYKCIMNMINNKSLSSPSVDEAFECNGDLESHHIGIMAGSFSSNPTVFTNVNALGAAIVENPDSTETFPQRIIINSDFCTNQNVNPVISAELFFHEFYHININYRLFFEHQWDGMQSTRAAKLQLLVNKDYPGKNYASDHQIMLGEFYDEMLNAIYIANGSIGNKDIYKGLIFNGFGDEEVFIQNKFGYNNSQLISFRNSFTQFINTPGNVSSSLLPCN